MDFDDSVDDYSTSSYNLCEDALGIDASAKEMINCVVNHMEKGEDPLEFMVQYFVVFSSALVFLMQAGFAMLVAGSVQLKNVGNSMLKNLLDACGASIAFYTVGFAIAFGDPENTTGKTFVGSRNFCLIGVEDLGFWLFQYTFSAASATIVAGTLAERCQMAAYLCYSVVLVGFVYPVIVHAIWSNNGLLSPYSSDPFLGPGVIDFAGSGVVHLCGGITALFATVILGPRKGRFHDEEGRPRDTPKEFPGHSIALQMLGCFILWFGWYGFNVGSALLLDTPERTNIAALVGVNSTLSAGFGGLSALFVNMIVLERLTGEAYFDLHYAMNGALAGLVAVTGGCGVIEPWSAIIVGFVAALLYIGGTRLLLHLRVDDAVDAVPVHMLNGMWGLLSIGIFGSPRRLQAMFGDDFEYGGWVYNFGDGRLLGAQIIGTLFISGWCTMIMLPFFVWLDWKGWFRADPLDEIVGLDRSYHGGLVLADSDAQPEYIQAMEKQRKAKKAAARSERSIGTHKTELAYNSDNEASRKTDYENSTNPNQRTKYETE